jgi:hypothetical protein
VAVFLITTAIGLVYYAAGDPDGPAAIGLFVATYTRTAQGDGRRSLQIVAAGIALLAVAWLLVGDLQSFNPAGWVLFRIGTAVMAATLGESVRGRRALAAEAVERAERAEQTKEAEARRRVDAERLRITDDGCGPRHADGSQGGRGIVGMRERAALLGGELTAGPRQGGGFQVQARLPLPPDQVVTP